MVSRWGDDGEYRARSATAWATALHLLRGTPYVYQGEELGMTNYPFRTLDDIADIESHNHAVYAVALGESMDSVLEQLRHFGRDNARTPMQWTSAEHAGFSTVPPWQPVHPNAATVNVEGQRTDPESVLGYFRRLIRLRHELPIITDGDYQLRLPTGPRLWVYTRSVPGETLLVVLNLSDDEVPLPDEARADGETVLANVPGAQGPTAQQWEARVLRV